MKEKRVDPKEAMKQIQKIFKKRGARALEMARKEILQDKIECKDAKEALSYFMTKYWHDLARPSLLSLTCEAVDGDPELTTPIAIPMTLISGAIDIHDDIIDQSKSKYGRPTVYGKYGKDIALLVGDALLFKGLILLSQATEKGIPTEKMKAITDIVKNMFFELGDAEALELQFRGNLDVSPKEYLRVVRKKAADVEAHTRLGAILGNASSPEIKALSEYGRLLGMMIILRDDIIDLTVPEECRSRIKKECLPLPLLYGLEDPDLRPKLKSMLQSKTLSNRETQEILKAVHDSKVINRYEGLIEKMGAKAISKLRSLRLESKELELLVEAMLPSTKQGKKT
jgi:geranylgeranyl pyrophosphate synthase